MSGHGPGFGQWKRVTCPAVAATIILAVIDLASVQPSLTVDTLGDSPRNLTWQKVQLLLAGGILTTANALWRPRCWSGDTAIRGTAPAATERSTPTQLSSSFGDGR